MASPVSVVNTALAECGNRVQINSFDDGTPASQIAALFYTQKIQMLARAANWDKWRAQIALTQLKAAVINGAISDDPPPSPWLYEYAYPSDCLKARFIQPTPNPTDSSVPLTTAPNAVLWGTGTITSIPYVVATDLDSGNNPISVILSNLYQAQLVYNRDLSQVPDLWDPLFMAGATALLASYFINALARDRAQMNDQIAIAKNVIDQARAVNANEGISNADNLPDWIKTRTVGAVSWGRNTGVNGVSYGPGYDLCQMADGQFY